MRVVEPSTGRELHRFTGAPPGATDRGVAVTPDGSIVVSSGRAGLVAWDTRTAEPQWVARLGAERCEALALSPLTRSVLCADALGGVQAFDVATGAPGRRYDLQLTPASALAVSPDGRELAEVGAVAPLLGRWRLDGSGAVARALGAEGEPSAFSPDGRMLVVDGPGTVRVGDERWPRSRIVDVGSGSVLRDLGALVMPLWTERSGTLVAWQGSSVVLVDLATGRPGLRLQGGPGGPSLRGHAVRQGRHLAVWRSEGGAQMGAVWNLATGDLVGVTQRPGWSSAWVPEDGSRLLLAGERGLVALATGSGTLSRGDRAVTAIAGSPSGRVVGATAVGRLFRIDPMTLRPVGAALPSSSGPVEHLALSDDGRLLLARSLDGGARLVDVDAGVQLGDAVDVRPYGTWAVLRPDGTALAVPGPSGVAVWQLDPRAWEAAACGVAGRGLSREEWRAHIGDLAPFREGCSPAG
jgi:hypothetical protein